MEVDFVASREAGKLRLWAVDLNMCPTASLSGFQLFDFLAAGQFDPATGTYWVPGMPEMPDLDAPMSPNQDALQQSEAIVSPVALATAQDELKMAMQPGYQDGHKIALSSEAQSRSQPEVATGTAAADCENSGAAHSSNDRHLYGQSAEVNSSHEHRQQHSTADQGQHCASGDDSADAAALHSTQDAALSSASRRPLTRSSEEVPDADSKEPVLADAAQPAARQGNAQEQSTSGVADIPDDITDESRQAQLSGPDNAAAWQQSESAIMQQEVQLEPRFYAAIDLLVHSGMHKRRSAQFLQNCRLAGLGFDMMLRQGLVLNFMDSMSSCCLGIQCAGPSPQLALQGLYKVICSFSDLHGVLFCKTQLTCMLDAAVKSVLPCALSESQRQTVAALQALRFMLGQFGETDLDGPNQQTIADPDAANFKNIYATIKFLADRIA